MYEYSIQCIRSISAYSPEKTRCINCTKEMKSRLLFLNDLSDGSTALDTLSILERYIITADDTNGWLNITLPFADLPAGRYL